MMTEQVIKIEKMRQDFEGTLDLTRTSTGAKMRTRGQIAQAAYTQGQIEAGPSRRRIMPGDNK